MDFSKLKIIIAEANGVLAADDLYIDELGNTPLKIFSKVDFEAINELKKVFKVVFVSNDGSIVYNLLRKKNIPFYLDEKDKVRAIRNVLNRYGMSPDEALYIGYSYSDLKCMQLIPMSTCPVDSCNSVMERVSFNLQKPGGLGIFSELHDLLLPEMRNRWQKS